MKVVTEVLMSYSVPTCDFVCGACSYPHTNSDFCASVERNHGSLGGGLGGGSLSQEGKGQVLYRWFCGVMGQLRP